MFEVGKFYRAQFGPKHIAECKYVGKSVVVLEAEDGSEFTPGSKRTYSYWGEYTPPKVYKFFAGIFKNKITGEIYPSSCHLSIDLLKQTYLSPSSYVLLKIVEIEYVEEEK